MTEQPDPDTVLREIQAKALQVRQRMTTIQGIGSAANGTIIATVDAAGHLRDLKLPRDAARLGPQLASMILQATADAEKDARQKSAAAVRPLTSDERIASGLKAIRDTIGPSDQRPTPRRAMTEEEIQAADDAYFERMNRSGWAQ
ncbi:MULTISPECIES: YbaB/EbfC family nucleoid-associated protein [Nocardia]|uniref:YbaB/EbfC family nucleoid-associated protein n=1 Tax=Nocardia TaxID=1817 RepID=UPI0007EA251F|nr:MULTISPECIES: YbaB/EbfC family nucleoid-associated protein [Nocardia]MBF6278687.1 YbaB/EbfC family nucleoid-associated protein [Nocardia nova]OBA50066.1 hypothetical protein A5789_02905 [Nocardia sp. 852002-51101_SCH5132738]OBB53603.1 hypothetical protein A5748_13850 [Nocardia sp. 852002-51244_SCH5132740]OBF63611.1 hypothetical protein A9X06_10080 [Mycobacterium sp. 852002-51759_SCH5129042]